MPMRAALPCRTPGCPFLVHGGGYCPGHQTKEYQHQDRNRGTATERGYDARWRKYRAAYLAEHPLCVVCLTQGRIEPAVVVDHIIPHRGDPVLFWDEKNHQGLCTSHHNAKTARESAFGRGRKW